MFYLYIIYSLKADKYYIGYSDNPQRRLREHNENPHLSFTSKHRPWILKCLIPVSSERGEAMKWEKYLKGLKSRKIIEALIVERHKSVRMCFYKLKA
jgi:putative endonuclease